MMQLGVLRRNVSNRKEIILWMAITAASFHALAIDTLNDEEKNVVIVSPLPDIFNGGSSLRSY